MAHYIEEEGLATTQISLVRLHTEKIKPPRALWVPYELGRPLGQPNDPEFQKRVLRPRDRYWRIILKTYRPKRGTTI